MLIQKGKFIYEISKSYKPFMNVPCRIYASPDIVKTAEKDRAIEQVANVAFLPGIIKYSLAMPDIHWGYGFCIGGVAATDIDNNGAISPAGVGYDINCGVRLMRSNLEYDMVKGKIDNLIQHLFSSVPSGVGRGGDIKVKGKEAEKVLTEGSSWAYKKGFGTKEDIEATEERGQMEGADPETVSEYAYKRGTSQIGTLGSGNHFLEIQKVDKIYSKKEAEVMGLFEGQIVVMIHSGSRGFGYQVCDDYVKLFRNNTDISRLPDKQLVNAPLNSDIGKKYFQAMKCAANYAWANRQVLMHLTRMAFEKYFRKSYEKLGLELVYDVAHNIAKAEEHIVDGKKMQLCVHRKGATRAFGPGQKDLPEKYKEIGQPVIIPGDMGRASYILTGTERAMAETFGTTCHGAGRLHSRRSAVKNFPADRLLRELEEKGIIVMSESKRTLSEEAPGAYKNIDDIIDIVSETGISKKVARLVPLAVMKG